MAGASGAETRPLNLVRATDQTAWAIPEPPPPPVRMPTNAKPEFTVTAIKPARPGSPRGGYGFRGRDVTATNETVNWLIKLAYNVHARQISGGPSWLDSERYDIEGKPDTPGFPGIGFSQAPGVISLVGRNTGLNGVANGLQSNILDKPVVDRTGLTGRYDFLLRFTPDAGEVANFGGFGPANATTNPDAPPDIFTAFEQQLGLKLQPAKAVVDVMVIDGIERPSPNY